MIIFYYPPLGFLGQYRPVPALILAIESPDGWDKRKKFRLKNMKYFKPLSSEPVKPRGKTVLIERQNNLAVV